MVAIVQKKILSCSHMTVQLSRSNLDPITIKSTFKCSGNWRRCQRNPGRPKSPQTHADIVPGRGGEGRGGEGRGR